MVEKYGVVFFWDEEYQGYVAEAVGLPGCFSQGKTMEEAIENIRDAIKGYLHVASDLVPGKVIHHFSLIKFSQNAFVNFLFNSKVVTYQFLVYIIRGKV